MLNSDETEGWRVFKSRDGNNLRPLVLLTGLIQRKSKFSSIFMKEMVLHLVSRDPTEGRLLPSSYRDWEIGPLPSLMISFQRDGYEILQTDSARLQY